MIKVEFLGPINKENLELEVKNLKELKEILQKDESLNETFYTLSRFFRYS